MPQVSHDDTMRKYLSDPKDAAAYLNTCIEDGHPWLIADALNTIMEIHGGDKKFKIKQQVVEELSLRLAPANIRIRFEAVPTRRAAPSKTQAANSKRVTKLAA